MKLSNSEQNSTRRGPRAASSNIDHIWMDWLSLSGLYVHTLPGRLRVEVPEIKGNPAQAARAEQLLRQIPGVNHVHCHTVSGRILVEFQPGKLCYSDILTELHDLGCFLAPSAGRVGPSSGAGVGRSLTTTLLRAATEEAAKAILFKALTVLL